MALSLAQLLTPKSEDEALTDLLAILDGLGFSASSWQSGSIQRTLVQLLARLQASASNTTLAITKGRFNDLAEGDWLSLLSTSAFANTREPAVATQVYMTLSDPLSVGPVTISVGQLVARDQAGKTYRNTAGLTVPANSTGTDLLFEAEVAGAATPDSLELATPIAGITAEKRSVAPIARQGAEAESDSRLRTRNKAKWSTLAYAAPADAYIAWALAASPFVTRAWVDDLNPRGPGTLDLYVTGPGGFVAPSTIDTVKGYIKGSGIGSDGVCRRPLGADLDVLAATTDTVGITGNLFVNAAYEPTAVRTVVYDTLTAYFDTLPVGGLVRVSKLYDVIMDVQGVTNIEITALAGTLPGARPVDHQTPAGKVPVPSPTFSAQVG